MAEMIIKDWCPRCGQPNFVNCGDPEDLTQLDVDGIKCKICSNIWTFEDLGVSHDELNIQKGLWAAELGSEDK